MSEDEEADAARLAPDDHGDNPAPEQSSDKMDILGIEVISEGSEDDFIVEAVCMGSDDDMSDESAPDNMLHVTRTGEVQK
ncbi:hypothetical protein B0H19DRAFT_1124424 [Mycena capillaripes]|nr:hypothetical protein B0H19DRAFT_1124424 [Mycena capillaripes]